MAEQRRFQKGDKVRVINGTSKLEDGSIHTIIDAPGNGRLCLEDFGPNWPYSESRFELVIPTADPVVTLPADPYEAHRHRYPDDAAVSRYTEVQPENVAARERRSALEAKLAAEHTRQADSSGLLHPKEFWSGRRGGRRDG